MSRIFSFCVGGFAHVLGMAAIFYGWENSLEWFTIGVLWYILGAIE
ncbi:hypothetical protein LCGC14_1675850 [marine sediment metagenome]|uniref:Uncharacterized protein n=1 Tax=marine sediment metagenome TaxID=412755 RepID=A0A0F9KPV0_9ZZZZ